MSVEAKEECPRKSASGASEVQIIVVLIAVCKTRRPFGFSGGARFFCLSEFPVASFLSPPLLRCAFSVISLDQRKLPGSLQPSDRDCFSAPPTLSAQNGTSWGDEAPRSRLLEPRERRKVGLRILLFLCDHSQLTKMACAGAPV